MNVRLCVWGASGHGVEKLEAFDGLGGQEGGNDVAEASVSRDFKILKTKVVMKVVTVVVMGPVRMLDSFPG